MGVCFKVTLFLCRFPLECIILNRDKNVQQLLLGYKPSSGQTISRTCIAMSLRVIMSETPLPPHLLAKASSFFPAVMNIALAETPNARGTLNIPV